MFHIGFLDPLGNDYHVVWLVNGVFIFYAISGYVTMLSTESGCEKFMLKRLIRIMPLYWFLTFATFAAMKVVPSVFPYEPSLTELIKSLFLISYSHQATATANAMYPIVSMGHTIQTTMLYYLVFWIACKLSFKNRGLISTVVLLAVVICGYALRPGDAFFRFYTKPDVAYFIVGIAVYYVHKRMGNIKFPKTAIVSVLLVLIFAATMYLHSIWIMSAAIFVLMLLSVTINDKNAFENHSWYRGLVAMGNWTFSYFLVHLYILRVVEVVGGTSFTTKAVACDFIGIIVAWGVSYLLYTIIEQRFTNVLKGWLLKR